MLATTSYKLVEAAPGSDVGVSFRGAARALWGDRSQEVIIAGPAETGKTFAALHKLNALTWKYPGSQAVIVRKTYKSTVASVIQTFARKVLIGDAVRVYGGERPEWFDYPNGSRVWVGGMDNPDKVLSSERDFIYVNQAEELDLADWETLLSRATGRAGNAPYAQLFGDCNPSTPHHWIRQRAAAGHLNLLQSKHEDNPTLYDDDGHITERGKRTMAVLLSMSGLRKKRLLEGLWVQAEGTVYDGFDEQVHVINPFEIPEEWRRLRVVDFGFTNPFVCHWYAVDHDGRMYLYREIYHTRRTVRVHAEQIHALSAGEKIERTVCDHDAGDRATLEENGIITEAARKSVTVGIEKVQERLKVQGDGKPRLFIFRDALVEADPQLADAHKPVCTAGEFPGYVWADNRRKDEPVKADDHGMDAVRYGVMAEELPAVHLLDDPFD